MKRIVSLVLVLVLALSLLVGCGGAKEKEYTLAIGVATEQDGAEVTNTVAAVIISDSKIVACRIDALTIKATLTDGIAAAGTYKTKAELGDAYGMLTNNDYYGSKLAEWYTQAQAYANTAVGKTAAEVAGLSTDKIEGACTIYVGGYKTALEKAASYTR